MTTKTATEFLHKVQDAVEQSGRLKGIDGRRVEYRANGQDVIIDGEVGSFYQAQLAQEIIRNVEGIGKIHNNLTIAIPMPPEPSNV